MAWLDGDVSCGEIIVIFSTTLTQSRGIFILEGLLTLCFAVGAFFIIYDFPSTASFLTGFQWKHVWAALKDWQVSRSADHTCVAWFIDPYPDPYSGFALLVHGKQSSHRNT